MVDYRLNETGENNCEVEWIGKKLKLNLVNLRKMYGDMEFVSSSITTQQCKQFFADFKKALKNDLGNEYNVNVKLGHFEVYGFVNKIGSEKFVYFSVEDLRENGTEFDNVLYRSAENEKDFTGGHNQFCRLEELDLKIKKMLD